jgi:hypothetical protein
LLGWQGRSGYRAAWTRHIACRWSRRIARDEAGRLAAPNRELTIMPCMK